MKILITNDDGIDSPFLLPLVETLAKAHELIVAAPAREQSWIGKAMSRRGSVDMQVRNDFPCQAYSLDGTPSDCVNIALGHLFTEKPDLAISGINIGHNAGLSFIASSGTIGGALEASLQNVPAIAASMYLDPQLFEIACKRDRPLPDSLRGHICQAATILERFARDVFDAQGARYGQVHSLNFPCSNLDEATIKPARAAQTLSSSLFERDGDQFHFAYKPLETLDADDAPTDRNLVHAGEITHTIIDYTAIDRG